MNEKIIKIKNKDLINLKYILGKIHVNDIRDHKKINILMKKLTNNKITIEEYNKQYMEIVNQAKDTMQNFKNNFIELYMCNIVYRKKVQKSLILYDTLEFDKIVNILKIEFSKNLIPLNIIETIASLDTSEFIDDTQKLCSNLYFTNTEQDSIYSNHIINHANISFSNMIINHMNQKLEECTKNLDDSKSLVKK